MTEGEPYQIITANRRRFIFHGNEQSGKEVFRAEINV